MAVKDSGKRQEFSSGMVRDVEEGKVDYTLIMDGPMFDRWAAHMTEGAKKYSPRNWMKAAGDEELTRFRKSAFRHFRQWMRGDNDEDHAAAVIFNLNGAEYVRMRMQAPPPHTGYDTSQEDYNFANRKDYGYHVAPTASLQVCGCEMCLAEIQRRASR